VRHVAHFVGALGHAQAVSTYPRVLHQIRQFHDRLRAHTRRAQLRHPFVDSTGCEAPLERAIVAVVQSECFRYKWSLGGPGTQEEPAILSLIEALQWTSPKRLPAARLVPRLAFVIEHERRLVVGRSLRQG